MSRSFLGLMQRLAGPRVSAEKQQTDARAHRAAISKLLPLELLTAIPDQGKRPARGKSRVAVVGGGFAGLAAANVLQVLGFDVTLFEARTQVGGRVESVVDPHHNPARIIEAGAELIGSSHQAWLHCALAFGLGLSVITSEEQYEEALLRTPIRLQGKELDRTALARLERGLAHARADLVARAKKAFGGLSAWGPRSPMSPWNAADAEELDNTTVQSWIEGVTRDERVRAVLALEAGNHYTVAASQQSLLGLLAQVGGGGYEHYWDTMEVFRCAQGNWALAAAFQKRLETLRPQAKILRETVVVKMQIVEDKVEVVTRDRDQSDPKGGVRGPEHPWTFDYAVLAVPPSTYHRIQLLGDLAAIPKIQTGPAVKYFAETKGRFWIRRRPVRRLEPIQGWSPSGFSDELGQTWDATDNQAGAQGIHWAAFAGGPWAEIQGDAHEHFRTRMNALVPGLNQAFIRGAYVDWPKVPFIETGYCCPAPGQVTTYMKRMQLGFGKRVYLAGEHCSPPFFGYMEGALQTGLAAACRIAIKAKVPLPPPKRPSLDDGDDD